MSRLLVFALIAGCAIDVPPIELPFADPIYSCAFERDGEWSTVELCYDSTPDVLELAIVASEPRVTAARCAATPVASCLYSCEPAQTTCGADNGCYCHH